MEPGGIFICYRRRTEDGGHAGRLRDRLVQQFGNRVFMDVHDISPGTRWAETIAGAIRRCRVAIVLIGSNWLTADAAGTIRIHAKDDPVRDEIRQALRGKLKMIPVLLPGAAMPARGALPKDIAALTELGAVHLHHDSFDYSFGQIRDQIVDVIGDVQSKAPTKADLAGAYSLLSVSSYGSFEPVGGEMQITQIGDGTYRLITVALSRNGVFHYDALLQRHGASWVSTMRQSTDPTAICNMPEQTQVNFDGTNLTFVGPRGAVALVRK